MEAWDDLGVGGVTEEGFLCGSTVHSFNESVDHTPACAGLNAVRITKNLP